MQIDDEQYMRLALEEAHLAFQEGEVPVGAIIMRNGEILAMAHNKVEALKQGNIAYFGELMTASHVSLRDDYEVTGPELDALAEAAWQVEGVLGSRMTGGGFGGCTVSLVKDEAIEAFKAFVGAEYEKKTGLKADFYVAEIGDGVMRLE